MRNLLALFGLLVIVFGVVGWYRGWYEIGSATGKDGQKQFQVSIDSGKITSDVKSATRKVGELRSEDGESEEPAEQPSTRPAGSDGPPPAASLPGLAPRDNGDVGTWWEPTAR